MAKNVNSRSSKQDYIDYARTELGISFPDEMSREDMYATIKSQLAALGADVTGEEAVVNEGAADASTNTPSDVQQPEVERHPSHYTIKVAKPPLCTVPDMVITANGVNTQIQFGKPVKISAAAYFALVDAVELVPAHRDLETKEWNPAREEPRFSFVVINEHHE